MNVIIGGATVIGTNDIAFVRDDGGGSGGMVLNY